MIKIWIYWFRQRFKLNFNKMCGHNELQPVCHLNSSLSTDWLKLKPGSALSAAFQVWTNLLFNWLTPPPTMTWTVNTEPNERFNLKPEKLKLAVLDYIWLYNVKYTHRFLSSSLDLQHKESKHTARLLNYYFQRQMVWPPQSPDPNTRHWGRRSLISQKNCGKFSTILRATSSTLKNNGR